RKAVKSFINADKKAEIVFTRNATESINLIAYSYGLTFVKEGDEIIVSILEHHSNMLPWQMVAKAKGATLKYLYCDSEGVIKPEDLEAIITDKTALVAITQVSNVIGRTNDIKAFADIAHKHAAVLVADGAQSVPHMRVDVQDLDVDFLAFSGHKMLAPMGIGVLYGKKELLKKMPPFLYGGEMIESVTVDGATFARIPTKFEAGTVNVGGAVGLKAAIEYINEIGMDVIEEREVELTKYAIDKLRDIPYLTLLGSDDAAKHHGIITFDLKDCHPHDVADILGGLDVNVRSGHHCAQPLLKHIGHPVTTRASLAFYNVKEDIDRLADALKGVRRTLGYGE
nr:aminotransferase class V-fold PLP-dependent enzyme [Lachnospiraceae bacterium]